MGLVSSNLDPVVELPQSQLDIVLAKLDSLIHVTAQIDRRMEALEERRERDAKLARQNEATATRLLQAMRKLRLREAILGHVPGVWVVIAAVLGAVISAAVVVLMASRGTVSTADHVRDAAELPAYASPQQSR